MRARVLAASAAVVGLGVLCVPGVAWAHHVYLDFDATGPQVPNGDPVGSASGTIDFNHEESDQLCIVGTSKDLDGILEVFVQNKTDQSTLVSFGASLNTCVTGNDTIFDALHDFASEYRLVVTTDSYAKGAVAGELVEQEPTTTTSSTTSSTSSSSTSTSTSTTRVTVNNATVTAAFTG